MPNNPVQIILNVKNYFLEPPPGKMGPATDFFAGRDAEFTKHRDKLRKQAASVSATMVRSGLKAGVVKVNLRKEAFAKSHRPQRILFPPESRPCVGVSALGELFFHVSIEDVTAIEREIASAETETRIKKSQKSGKEYFSPSEQRSDAGAIDSISFPDAADKRTFELPMAVDWLSDPKTSGAYFVEFFGAPTGLMRHAVISYFAGLTEHLSRAVTDAGLKVITFPVDVKSERARPSGVVGFRLVTFEGGSFDADQGDHARLLKILEADPYVRKIALPPLVAPSNSNSAPHVPTTVSLPPKLAAASYPKVGIVDGGVATHLNPWLLDTHEGISPQHVDAEHGSFIGGLLVAGRQLNGAAICDEADGCNLFDIRVFPDAAFDSYYPQGIVDFFNEIDVAVEIAKRDHGVRIFNMSLNLISPVEADSYSAAAHLVDEIADKHNVLFVISAGNLGAAQCRPEWPSDPKAALQQLAARIQPDTIMQPAESARSLAVAALNAPGCTNRVHEAPTSYTRRGPGLRVGVKPDVAFVGGCMPDNHTDSGLWSVNASCQQESGHGTSYAAPLVAKTLGAIENKVSSHLTREMLVALLIHSCRKPHPLGSKDFSQVMRQFTGFGIPGSSDAILETPDHAITLVFSDVLHAKRALDFSFTWPQALVETATGACRGDVKMTLVYRPPLEPSYGAEFVRVNLDAYLRQEQGGTYANRTAHLTPDSGQAMNEQQLIDHGLKWWPIKTYEAHFPRGKGTSSNWQISLKSLLRAGEVFPPVGVPFALIVTISDDKQAAPVFQQMRRTLTSQNVQMSDIRTRTNVRV